MDPMIGYCGLSCGSCPIHLATLEPDAAKRQAMKVEVARLCTETYGMRLAVEQVSDCDGCRAGGRLFGPSRSCRIRECAEARRLESCAFCADYPCDVLERHLAMDPSARDRLEALRAGGSHGARPPAQDG